MRFIHLSEYEYVNNYVQNTILHTSIHICMIYVTSVHCYILTIQNGSYLVAHLQCVRCDLWSARLLQYRQSSAITLS